MEQLNWLIFKKYLNGTSRTIVLFLSFISLIIFCIKIQGIHGQQPVSTPDYHAWITVESGRALYLDPESFEWIPLSGQVKIPIKTYVLTHDSSSTVLYHQTDVHPLPPDSYIYLQDVLTTHRTNLVKKLTQIEAEQLPVPDHSDDNSSRKLGVTYGKNTANSPGGDYSIPYLEERFNAVQWYLKQNRVEVSLLLLKRVMTKYPVLYKEPENFDLLCSIYEQLNLNGFLYNETQKVMQMKTSQELKNLAINWSKKIEKNVKNN